MSRCSDLLEKFEGLDKFEAYSSTRVKPTDLLDSIPFKLPNSKELSELLGSRVYSKLKSSGYATISKKLTDSLMNNLEVIDQKKISDRVYARTVWYELFKLGTSNGKVKIILRVEHYPMVGSRQKLFATDDLTKIANYTKSNYLRTIDEDELEKYEGLEKYEAYSSNGRLQPKNKKELKQIIEDTIEEKGNNCDLNFIDTSKITDMSYLFRNSNFNGDISEWDTSKVRDMQSMFEDSVFNGDISKWNVSKVENMSFMFCYSKFNGDISKWDVSNVRDMAFLFAGSKFNGNISKWNISKVRNITSIFEESPLEKIYGNRKSIRISQTGRFLKLGKL